MNDEHGLAGKVPTEIWLAYERRATDYAAMHGNGSAALKAGILRLTLDAWLAGQVHAGEPLAWTIVYADGSRGLAFTEEEADEAIAEANLGAIRGPLFASASHPSSNQGGGSSALLDAAQDLLDAAKAQEALMRTPGDPTENIQRVIKMRRTAIAKAEGRL